MITFPLLVPRSEDIDSIRITGESRNAFSQSPFTGEIQVHEHQGKFWRADIRLAPLPRANAESWLAFFFKLDGRKGTFLMGDPSAGVPRGDAQNSAGVPLVFGGSQSGDVLVIDGVPSSVDNYLMAGDYVQISSFTSTRLHKVLDNVSTTSGGVASLQIWPKLRSSPADNTVIFVGSAQGIWRLNANQANWEELPVLYNMEFTAIEAL